MKSKILMVCLGNICRSPLAEGILKSKLDTNNFIVASCGTSGYHIGEKPDHRSIKVARSHGIDISTQTASKFIVDHFDIYDIIYAMDESNYQNILKLSRNDSDSNKVRLILKEANSENDLHEVPDPYYGSYKDFEYVFDILDTVSNTIAKNLSKL